MAITWDEARIVALNDVDLVQLRDNAQRKSNAEISDLCTLEIEKRGLHQKAKRARSATVSDDPLRMLQHDVAIEMGEFARSLASQFDLSAETAQKLSEGTLRFKSHNFTQANGTAKLGGLQRAGKCRIDRYISYRVKDTVLSLHMFLAKDADDAAVTYQVFGPKEHLPEGKPLKDLRPGLEAEAESKLFQWGQQFDQLSDAKTAMAELVGKIAARRES